MDSELQDFSWDSSSTIVGELTRSNQKRPPSKERRRGSRRKEAGSAGGARSCLECCTFQSGKLQGPNTQRINSLLFRPMKNAPTNRSRVAFRGSLMQLESAFWVFWRLCLPQDSHIQLCNGKGVIDRNTTAEIHVFVQEHAWAG